MHKGCTRDEQGMHNGSVPKQCRIPRRVVRKRGSGIRRPGPEIRRKSEIHPPSAVLVRRTGSPNAAWPGGRLCSPGRLGDKACPRKQRRSSSVVTRWQCRWGRGCASGVGGVGRVWRVCALGEGDRNGRWRELRHFSWREQGIAAPRKHVLQRQVNHQRLDFGRGRALNQH
jgi:hypothetical protein